MNKSGTILQTIHIECIFKVLNHSYGTVMEEWEECDMYHSIKSRSPILWWKILMSGFFNSPFIIKFKIKEEDSDKERTILQRTHPKIIINIKYFFYLNHL